MSNQDTESTGSALKGFFDGLIIFLIFGVISALLFSGYAGGKQADKDYKGVFDQATRDQRDANLAEVSEAQAKLVDAGAVAAAMKKVTAGAGGKKPAKTDLVVPGSPTFLKQAAEQAAPAEEEKTEAEGEKKAE